MHGLEARPYTSREPRFHDWEGPAMEACKVTADPPKGLMPPHISPHMAAMRYKQPKPNISIVSICVYAPATHALSFITARSRNNYT